MELRVERNLDRSARIGLDVTLRDLFESHRFQHDFLAAVLDDLKRGITREVEKILFDGDLDKLIKEAIREEVKRQVAATVEERLEDFFGEE